MPAAEVNLWWLCWDPRVVQGQFFLANYRIGFYICMHFGQGNTFYLMLSVARLSDKVIVNSKQIL